MIIGIIFYMLIFIVGGFFAFCEYSTAKKHIENSAGIMKRKMPFRFIIFFSLVAAFFNYYCTSISVGLGNDRTNYLYDFSGYRSASVGLDFVFKIIKSVSGDIYTVFYFTTFVCCVLTLVAYRESKNTDYNTLLFLLSTNFVIFTFTGLKQCYACGFAAIFFSIALRDRTIKRDFVCILMIVLACAFHPTGFILVPCFVFIRAYKNKSRYTRIAVVLLLCFAVFIQPISLLIAHYVAGPFPQLAMSITNYLGNEALQGGTTINATFIQGIPLYAIVIIGIFKRKRIAKSEEKIILILTISGLGTFFYLFSAVSYWMSRFTSLFFLPIGILFALIIKNSCNSNKTILRVSILSAELFITLRSFVLVYTVWGGF